MHGCHRSDTIRGRRQCVGCVYFHAWQCGLHDFPRLMKTQVDHNTVEYDNISIVVAATGMLMTDSASVSTHMAARQQPTDSWHSIGRKQRQMRCLLSGWHAGWSHASDLSATNYLAPSFAGFDNGKVALISRHCCYQVASGNWKPACHEPTWSAKYAESCL